MRDSREQIIQRARFLRAEIAEHFNDVAHWNRTHSAIEHLDADPQGELQAIADGLDVMLSAEST